MGRLIEESSVIEVAEKFTFTDENEKRKCLDFIRYCVKNSKTAYDVEKVIQQLREHDGTCTGCNSKPDECEWCSVKEKLDIVKAGGVE